MSCHACDEAQEYASNNMTGHNLATFVRVDNGNVLISGCETHLRMTIEKLRAGSQAQSREDDDAEEE